MPSLAMVAGRANVATLAKSESTRAAAPVCRHASLAGRLERFVGILSKEANRAAAGAWYHLAREDGERLEDGREPKGAC